MAGEKTTVGELVYQIKADVDGLKTGVASAESSMKKLTGTMQQQTNEQSKAVLKGTAAFAILQTVVQGATRAAISFFSSSIKAAEDQQVANAKLANNLQNVVGARQGDYEALIAQSNAMQKTTAIADEEIVNNQALLATFQLNGAAIQQLIPRILDMGAANAKTGELTADLQGATMAVGKAFTSGVGILSRYGVAMTDAQKKAFDLADEHGKLSILTKVLDDNFKGAAETVGQTFAGRVARAKNSIDELKEGIGFALMPTLEQMLGIVNNTTDSVAVNSDNINVWGKRIYQAFNFGLTFVKVLKLMVEALTALADTFVSVNIIGYNFAKDLAHNFTNLGNIMKSVASGIAQGFKGDFEGATKTFSEMAKANFSNTLSSMSELSDKTQGWTALIKEDWDDVNKSALNAVNANGYKQVTDAAVKSYRSMSDAAQDHGKVTKDNAKATADDLKNLADKFDDLRNKGSDALIELEATTTDKLNSIGDKIKDLKQNLADLGDELQKNLAGENKSIAERFVAEQQALTDLQAKISANGGSSNPDNQKDQADLDKRRAALQAAQDLETTYAADFAEAKRRASLTDFQRDIEDALAKKAQLQKDYDDKKADIDARILLEEDEKTQTVALYELKKTEINKIIEDANKQFEVYSNERVSITRKEVNAQISAYNELAASISRAKQAQTSNLLTKPQFAVGGFVDGRGGEVHPGEYVIPAHIVNAQQGLVGALESMRQGGSSRTINANTTINASLAGPMDFESIAREMAWQFNRQ